MCVSQTRVDDLEGATDADLEVEGVNVDHGAPVGEPARDRGERVGRGALERLGDLVVEIRSAAAAGVSSATAAITMGPTAGPRPASSIPSVIRDGGAGRSVRLVRRGSAMCEASRGGPRGIGRAAS